MGRLIIEITLGLLIFSLGLAMGLIVALLIVGKE